jgi:hypothetical protein
VQSSFTCPRRERPQLNSKALDRTTDMHSLRIVALSVAAAVCYGILHDQVTARICVEYFTIGHPPLFATESPTLLAFGWGVVATWWVGVPLGVVLSLAARVGARPRLSAHELLRPTCVLLLVMGFSALLAGTIGGVLAQQGIVTLPSGWYLIVPRSRHVRFLVDLWAHTASYCVGIVGGLALALWTWRARRRLGNMNLDSKMPRRGVRSNERIWTPPACRSSASGSCVRSTIPPAE